MYTGAGLKNEWAGNLNGQSFDDITFEDGITYTAILAATSGSSVASLGTVAGLQYFSTLTATPATGTATIIPLIQPVLSCVAGNTAVLKRDPKIIFGPAPPVDYSALVLASSPKGFWKAQDASGNLTDSSGGAFHLPWVPNGTQYHQPGPGGTDYSEVDGYWASVPSNITTASNNITMEAWVKPVLGGAFVLAIIDAETDGYVLEQFDNTLALGVNGFGSVVTATATLTYGTWNHVAIVRDSGTWKFYINGTLDVTTDTTAPGAIGTTNTAVIASSTNFAYAAFYETVLSAGTILSHSAAFSSARSVIATGLANLVKQPQRVLAAVASNTVSVKRTALKTLKANATMVAWSFLHRCGISAFSQIYAERNWGATYHVTGWTMDASSNYSYSVRQGIYGCS